MPQLSQIIELSSPISIDKIQFKITETENIITLPSTQLYITKMSTANVSLDNNHITSTLMTQLSDATPQTIIKTTVHP